MHREMAGRDGNVLLAFLAGALAGAMAALLTTRRSAAPSRNRIARQIRDGLRRGQREQARGGVKRREKPNAEPHDGGVAPSAGRADATSASVL